jgi:predicted DCC family thiol-disulfide oxidoreductase YuxK
VLIFDGTCGFCTSFATVASRRFGPGVRSRPSQTISDDELATFGLSRHDVEMAAWWVDPHHGVARGHRAIGRALQSGGGLGWIVGSFVLVPPTSWVAALVYRLVVRWRHVLPGGTSACRIDPPGPSSTGSPSGSRVS